MTLRSTTFGDWLRAAAKKANQNKYGVKGSFGLALMAGATVVLSADLSSGAETGEAVALTHSPATSSQFDLGAEDQGQK